MTTRRSAGHRISGRTLLIAMPVTALLAWGGLLLFTYFVQPPAILAVVVVFLLLALALVSTFSSVIYLIRKKFSGAQRTGSTLKHTIREAVLLAIYVVFNLLLRLLQSWSIFTALVVVAIIVVVEILALGGS